MPTYRIVLVRHGKARVEDWWARTGRPVPTPASTAEWIHNQLSFVTFELNNAGISTPQSTESPTEFLVADVPVHKLASFSSIVRYHGFDVVGEERG